MCGCKDLGELSLKPFGGFQDGEQTPYMATKAWDISPTPTASSSSRIGLCPVSVLFSFLKLFHPLPPPTSLLFLLFFFQSLLNPNPQAAHGAKAASELRVRPLPSCASLLPALCLLCLLPTACASGWLGHAGEH